MYRFGRMPASTFAVATSIYSPSPMGNVSATSKYITSSFPTTAAGIAQSWCIPTDLRPSVSPYMYLHPVLNLSHFIP